MKESRLFQIVYYLLEKGQASAPELAERFEVSVRTIYRDMDALSGAGIPIYAEAGRNGGIRLMKDFVLDKAVFSEEEKQEILTALQSMQMTGTAGSQTLQKLSAMFQLHSEHWLEVDFSRWGHPKSDHDKFESLKSAVICHRNVRLHYAGTNEVISERVVQPTKLVYKSRAWYLRAFCTEKQAFRTFKLNRILDLEVLEESFSPQNDSEPMDTFEGTCRPITLRFPKEMTYRVYDEFDRTQVRHLPDGDLLVFADLPEDAWLTGFLLSFGTQVEILSPASLREAVAEQAGLIYEKYKT